MLIWLAWAAIAESVLDDIAQHYADWYWRLEFERVVAEMARAEAHAAVIPPA